MSVEFLNRVCDRNWDQVSIAVEYEQGWWWEKREQSRCKVNYSVLVGEGEVAEEEEKQKEEKKKKKKKQNTG